MMHSNNHECENYEASYDALLSWKQYTEVVIILGKIRGEISEATLFRRNANDRRYPGAWRLEHALKFPTSTRMSDRTSRSPSPEVNLQQIERNDSAMHVEALRYLFCMLSEVRPVRFVGKVLVWEPLSEQAAPMAVRYWQIV